MAVHVNNERELAKMGLALDPGDPNRLIRLQDVGEVQPMSREKMRCESFDNDVIDNLDPAVAEQLAIDRNGKINEAGAYITGLYWDLGAALLKLRELYGKHGEWERKLARMGIERTRATKAMRIKQTFTRRTDCEQMSVERAYAMRKRKKTVEYDTPHPPDHSCFTPNESLRVYNCRFEDLEQLGGVKPETVDLLLTDPPYLQEWLTQMPTLAGFVARMLKPGGRAVFYYGNMFLNHLVREMEAKQLTYFWTFCHPYATGSCRSINRRGIQQDWKPVVLFGKENGGANARSRICCPPSHERRAGTIGNNRCLFWSISWRCFRAKTTWYSIHSPVPVLSWRLATIRDASASLATATPPQ